MSNRCSETLVTSIAIGATSKVFALTRTQFKSVKLVFTVKNMTTNLVQAFEAVLTYSVGAPVSVYHTIYAILGDSLTYTVTSTYDSGTDEVRFNIQNQEANIIEVYVGEVERVE